MTDRQKADRGERVEGHRQAAIEAIESALTILHHDEGGESAAITNLNNALYHLCNAEPTRKDGVEP